MNQENNVEISDFWLKATAFDGADGDSSSRWKDLPADLLEKIASGRDDLKVMREVCPGWKTAYEVSVTRIWNLQCDFGLFLSGARVVEYFPWLHRQVYNILKYHSFLNPQNAEL